MPIFWVIVIILAIIGAIGLTVVGLALLLPDASQAAERVRIEQEAAEASWKIHQQANQAFGDLLEAARNHDPDGLR